MIMTGALLLLALCTAGAATLRVPHPQQQHYTSSRIPQLQLLEGLSNRFVPELQVPAVEVSASNVQINAVTDLGANNPSKQCSADGTSCNYHYARGDAGWISAFETANTYGVQKIYFPRGQYWFGKVDGKHPSYNSTAVDISMYPRLWNGARLEVYGEGMNTHFTTWAPIADGPMLLLTSSKTVATMSWQIHGMHFDGCSTDYAFSLNHEYTHRDCTHHGAECPRAEHNNIKVYDMTFYNHLENNTCHGNKFPAVPGQTSTNAKGAVYLAHVWSSSIDFGLATVATAADSSLFNTTAGAVLDEVQYSTLSLRGTGTHSDASFSGPEPWNTAYYGGWGIILVANCNSNTIIQTHCEGSGGCVLISGPGNFENQWTSAVMSMMQRVLIASHDPPGDVLNPGSNYNVFHSVVANRYPVKNPSRSNETECFSQLVEGRNDSLLVKHMTVIGGEGCPKR